MANGNTNPMERVKMLNMREETMLRKELETIHVLEKKKLHLLNKDTINLRMELRAHRFRAMKSVVREKGALQEFDEKWKERAQSQLIDPRARGQFIGDAHPEVRESFINHTKYARHSASARHTPVEGRRTPSLQTGLSKSSDAFYPRPASQKSNLPIRNQSASVRQEGLRTNNERNTLSPAQHGVDNHCRSPAGSNRGTPVRPQTRDQDSPIRRKNNTWVGNNTRSSDSPSAPSPRPSEGTSTTSSKRRKIPTASSRRSCSMNRVDGPKGENTYLTRLVQSIAGGATGAKVSGQRGGKDPNSLLDKLKSHTFDQYTDGSMAMEIRKLRQKKMSVHAGPQVKNPEDLLPPSQRGKQTQPQVPEPPKTPRTAPPDGRPKRIAKPAFHAWRRQATAIPHTPIVARKKSYDADEALAKDNEGLLRLHREGQKQEYERVLRRVNRFLGKPFRAAPAINKDNLSKEDLLLLNKVRPPKRRLKGAVKLVMFLNKAKGLSILGQKKAPQEGRLEVPCVS